MASEESDQAGRLCLFGAAGDTWNLGVSALMRSVVAAAARLDAASGPIELTVFDNGRGIRRAALSRASGPPFDYALMGARHSRRLHQRETLVTAVAAGRLTRRGGFGWTAHHPLVSRVRAADAVLDLSGGDSFTDLYGAQRFRQIVLHKRLTLDLRRPLVLLPQTYGPFRDERNRRVAVDLVRRAHTAWARDEQSFEALRDLLGDDLDPRRHRVGTDVAFGLEPRRPDDPPEGRLRSWLEDRPAPLVGINVSGLIWHDSRRHYGLRLDYRQLMSTLVRRLVDETDAVVALVPHVIAPHGHPQSDRAAAEELLASLGRAKAARVIVAPNPVGPAEAKWLIGQMDWFCGTRMHATIAALSSGVPSAGVAYSPKTVPVFARAGEAAAAADATALDLQDALAVLWSSWETRRDAAARLAVTAPRLVAEARSDLDALIGQALGAPVDGGPLATGDARP